MTIRRVLSVAAVLAATTGFAHAQFGGMPGMPGSPAPGGFGGSPFGGPPAGPPPACQQLLSMRDETQKQAQAIQAANKRHASATEACKLFKTFLSTESKFMQSLEQNTATCGVPPDAIKQAHEGHEHASQIAKQVC